MFLQCWYMITSTGEKKRQLVGNTSHRENGIIVQPKTEHLELLLIEEQFAEGPECLYSTRSAKITCWLYANTMF